MTESKVKIKIYSDSKKKSNLIDIISRIIIEGISITCQAPRHLKVEENDIIVLLVDNITSNLLDNIIELKDKCYNKFILVTRNDNALFISSIVKLGFNDIFLFPYEIPNFISFINMIINNKLYVTVNENKNEKLFEFESIIGTSPRFAKTIEVIKKVSENTNVSVLLLGETGTGKNLLAKTIHKNSNYEEAPFVEIVCSAIPEDLLESELFGHEKGAFTNALYKKIGLFELAENGTLFLDEIGDLSLNLQVKLLRVIEKKVIRRLGSVEDIPISTRIISATNKNLAEMVDNNLFRTDLYHRLNVVSILIPPLRDRGNDIILLTERFVEQYNSLFGKSINKFEKGLKEFLLSYSWPGNVRELKNAVERAVLLSEKNTLKVADFEMLLKNLPLNILEKDEHIRFHPNLVRLDVNYKKTDLFNISKAYAAEVLRKMKGNKTKSAQLLGISRPKLDKLLNNKL